MCLPKPPKDNSAEIARQQEEARAAKIREGRAGIDSTFDSTFNDDFYNARTKDYQDFYNPELATQYEDAVKNMTFQLARSGNAQSSTNNEQFAKLEKARADAAAKIANDALAATGALKSNVAGQRSNLYTLNNSAADPTQAASQAAQAALQLNQPQSYSPLGSVFASFIQNGGNAAAINNATTGGAIYGGTGPSAPTGNTSSGFVRK
jgi:hypothetical protein